MLDSKEFENQAWEMMQQQLDREMPIAGRKKKKILAFWIWGTALILVAGFLVANSVYNGAEDNVSPEVANNMLIDQDNKSSRYEGKISQATIENEQKEEDVMIGAEVEATSTIQSSVQGSEISEGTSIEQQSFEQSSNGIKSTRKSTSINKEEVELFSSSPDNSKSSPLAENYGNSEKSLVIVELDKALAKKTMISDFNSQQEKENQVELNSRDVNMDAEIATFSKMNTFADSKEWTSPRMVLSKIPRERVTSLYVFSEAYYLTDIEILNAKFGVLAEIGAESSQWSFSTGISFERNHLKETLLYDFFAATFVEDADANILSGVTEVDETVIDYTTKADYINLPLQFHYRMNRIRIGLGIENSFLLSSETATSKRTVNALAEEQHLNPYQLSVTQSAWIRLGTKWDLGINYSYDLTGLYSAELSNKTDNLNNVGLSLAYKFN